MLNHIRSNVEEPTSKKLKISSEEEETCPQWEGYKLKRSTKYYIKKMKITNGPTNPDPRLNLGNT
ncbi:MAG: hypothetical protein KBA81_05450 [Rhabdochlamydiaceae bacterium]|nr:hypothetical protein [Rhabdochlamydiaceae bacterium]